MRLKLLFYVVLFTITQFGYAQTDFREGFIIQHNGDTVFGKIDYRNDGLMGKVCRFKASNATKSKKYLPCEIKAYRFIDSKYFISAKVLNKDSFLEFLINGIVNIYYLRDDIGDHYFIKKGDGDIKELPYTKSLITSEDGTLYNYETTRHLGFLKHYMQDAVGFESEIYRIGRPEHRNLINLAKKYHYKVCDGEKCIIYRKKEPLLRMKLELITGGFSRVFSTSSDTEIDDVVNDLLTFNKKSLFCDFWMPRANESLFFRTGLIRQQVRLKYSNVSIEDHYYTVPFQFGYMYENSVVRPKIVYGLNFFDGSAYSVSLMAGVDVKLYKNFALSLNFDLNSSAHEKLLILPGDVHIYTFSAGISYSI